MHPFEHIDAPDLSTAVTLLNEPGTEAFAGGTDLLGELKRRIKRPRRLVNLKTIPGMKGLQLDENLRMGALVTLSEVEHHPAVQKEFPILTQALSHAATVQLRNMGTVAGNLCQYPRCWYYRNPLFNCWLKGGEKCFAANGENRYHAILGNQICHAVHGSDLAPALIALNARVKVDGFKVRREISLEELYTKPSQDHRQMTILGPGELVTEIYVPRPSKKSRGIYLKVMERKAWSFALVSVAVHLNFDGNQIREARLVLGGVAQIPWRAEKAEKVLSGQSPSEALFKSAGEAALAGARPLRQNEYKIRLAKELVRRALIAATP